MSGALPTSPNLISLLGKPTESVADGLRNLAGAERGQAEANETSSLSERFGAFANFLQSHTSETGEIKPGPAPAGSDSDTMISEFRTTRQIADNQQAIPQKFGPRGKERTIDSGELTISVKSAGRAKPTQTRVAFLNEVDATFADRDSAAVDLAASATTLAQLAERIDAISGVSAELDGGKLHITSSDSSASFSIEDDGSGLLAAMGGENVEAREMFDRFVGTTLYGQMLSAMRKTVGEPAYLHGGQAENIFRNQLDATLAEELTQAGGGEFSDSLFKAQFNSWA